MQPFNGAFDEALLLILIPLDINKMLEIKQNSFLCCTQLPVHTTNGAPHRAYRTHKDKQNVFNIQLHSRDRTQRE